MMYFFYALKDRNETLFYFGLLCLISAVYFLIMSKVRPIQVSGANAWNKPAKFGLSIFLYSWTMAWFCFYLPDFNIAVYNWVVIVLLGFEIVYIAIQAARGQLSHYNQSTALYSFLFQMMGLAAVIITFWTAYICLLFFTENISFLPAYYLWSIRLGIVIFIIFSLEGVVMGARASHTIGGVDEEKGLPFLNWSKKFGDPRAAHFIGMHALQVLPLLSWYVLKNLALTLVTAFLYGLLASYTLSQALKGKPFIGGKKEVVY